MPMIEVQGTRNRKSPPAAGFDGPPSLDVRHANVVAVGRRARVIRAVDGDLVAMGLRVHTPAEADGVVAIPD